MAATIKENGIQQPIKCFKTDNDEYVTVSGHIRFAAAQSIELKDIPTIIVAEEEAPLIAMLENISQNSMLPLEEALALKELLVKIGKNQDELARTLGISKSSMSEKILLTKLPSHIQEVVLKDPEWSANKLRVLAKIADNEKQNETFVEMKKEIEKKVAHKKENESKPKGRFIRLEDTVKRQKDYNRLAIAAGKFNEDFRHRITKIVPENCPDKYSQQIQSIQDSIDELLKKIQADYNISDPESSEI